MNTPYAYAIVQGEDGRENVSLQFDHPEMCGQKYNAVIPLYTHPVELTDEEICNLWVEHGYGQPLSNIAFEFARAILRKAQEK